MPEKNYLPKSAVNEHTLWQAPTARIAQTGVKAQALLRQLTTTIESA